MTRFRAPRLTAAASALALLGLLSVAGCSADDESDSGGTPAAASDAVEDVPDEAAGATDAEVQAVMDSFAEFYGTLVDEAAATVAAELDEGAMADFAAYVDEWFPQTSEWVAWDTFESDTHAYAALRTVIGFTVLGLGFAEDRDAAAAEAVESATPKPEWVTVDGGIASIVDPELEGDDTFPVNLIERDGYWLIEGSRAFTDEWFAQQGTTAEEALDS